MKKAFLIMGLLGMLSCSPTEKGYKAYTKSFVIEYYSLSGIDASWRNGYIELRVIPNGETYGALSTDNDGKIKYETLCNVHNDNTYNREFNYTADYLPNRFQDRDFISIEITSDQDYNETHPAGTSLNDIFYFASSSPAKYIARGYKTPYDWSNSQSLPEYFSHYLDNVSFSNSTISGYEPVYGFAADLERTDLILLGGTERKQEPVLATLTPANEPVHNKTHNIKITLADTNENKLVANVKITF